MDGFVGRARTVRMCQVVRTHVLHGDSYTCQIMTPNCMCQKCFRFRSDRYVPIISIHNVQYLIM